METFASKKSRVEHVTSIPSGLTEIASELVTLKN
jgi:hypothetical protein